MDRIYIVVKNVEPEGKARQTVTLSRQMKDKGTAQRVLRRVRRIHRDAYCIEAGALVG